MELSTTSIAGLQSEPRQDRRRGVLMGSRCAACGAGSWPARSACHRCGERQMEALVLSHHGILVTFTTVHVARPGVQPPYVLGQVDLPEGIRLFGQVRRLREPARLPLPVRLIVPSEETALPTFWFEPTADQAGSAPERS